MITLADINEAYKNASKPEKQEFINMILPDLKESPIFKFAVETAIATSELGILPRLTQVEMVTGKYDFEDFEDHEPTIPEQITEMKKKINCFESARVIVAANMEPEIDEDLLIQNTTLTQKANALTEYLKEKIKPSWSGKTVIENDKIYDFFYNVVNKEIRWPAKMKGYRNAKKLIIERAVELHPDDVEIVRNKSGNKITGLALKASMKRIGAYGC